MTDQDKPRVQEPPAPRKPLLTGLVRELEKKETRSNYLAGGGKPVRVIRTSPRLGERPRIERKETAEIFSNVSARRHKE